MKVMLKSLFLLLTTCYLARMAFLPRARQGNCRGSTGIEPTTTTGQLAEAVLQRLALSHVQNFSTHHDQTVLRVAWLPIPVRKERGDVS
jgi:hypothetical protein